VAARAAAAVTAAALARSVGIQHLERSLLMGRLQILLIINLALRVEQVVAIFRTFLEEAAKTELTHNLQR